MTCVVYSNYYSHLFADIMTDHEAGGRELVQEKESILSDTPIRVLVSCDHPGEEHGPRPISVRKEFFDKILGKIQMVSFRCEILAFQFLLIVFLFYYDLCSHRC